MPHAFADYLDCDAFAVGQSRPGMSRYIGTELSSYVSRHSWATLAHRKGIAIEIISESMGHENETTTRIYLASLGQAIIDRANAEIIALK